ncbi:MAG: sigma-E factor negative regulatory protein [Gammaproteobacteria bacterium]|jgi:sigma-E factor negative regulatory protein RseA|nr:sigma-E factor negative regulatory protein [Gammaproteobacteria bacterium]
MSETANDKTREILSAFADNESSPFEEKLSLKELLNSEEQRARWARYHIIGDALRQDTPVRIDPGFPGRVMRQVERLPLPSGAHPAGGHRSGFLKPVASLAMAVTVAVVTVLGVRALNSLGDGAVEGPVVASGVISETNSSAATDLRAGGLPPETQVNLDRYLARHAGYVPSRGMTPYARIVGYDMDGD